MERIHVKQMDRWVIVGDFYNHCVGRSISKRGFHMVEINRWGVGRSEVGMEREYYLETTRDAKNEAQARETKLDDQIFIEKVKRRQGPFFKE